jgi:hypothetical protein
MLDRHGSDDLVRSPQSFKEETRMGKRAWKDEFYVKAFELARTGLTDKAIAEAIGISPSVFKTWRLEKPALKDALTRARGEGDNKGRESFKDFVYNRLPDDLKELWDDIEACERRKNSVQRIEAMLKNRGKGVRQHLFLFALTSRCFSVSEACRAVNIPRKTFEGWVLDDPDFAEMVEEIHIARKDFCEGSLMSLIAAGDTAATIFANKAINKDRGYGEKSEITVSGSVDHKHLHAHVVKVDDLDLPLTARRQILSALREEQDIKRLELEAEQANTIDV